MTVEKLIELLNEAGEHWNYFDVRAPDIEGHIRAQFDGDWDLTKLAKAITESEKGL